MWHTPRFPERILVSLRDRGPTGSRRSSHRRAARPRLEALEGRALLSVWYVTDNSDDPSDTGSLRYAINQEPSGTTIEFKGVHSITLTNGELQIDKSLDIEGPGANKLAISGNDSSRVFDISPGVTVTIAGMTITDGRSDGNSPVVASTGGGVLNQGSLTLSNDVLSNNQALGQNQPLGRAIGGGVANLGPELDVTACQFINNQARGADAPEHANSGTLAGSGVSGAIGNPPSPFTGGPDFVSVTGSLFAGNVARGGSGWTGENAGTGIGGSISNGGELSVTGSIFTANQAIGGNDNTGSPDEEGGGGLGVGGAISSRRLRRAQSLVVTGSLFAGNVARGGSGNEGDRPNIGAGGAISVLGGSGNIRNCTLDHNLALGGQGAAGSSGGDGLGGGIANFFVGEPTLTVTRTTVDHNKAQGGDGGAGGNGYGGGLYNDALSTLTLTDATVQFNFAIGGAGSGGSDGDGIGGGVWAYSTETFSFDGNTAIKKNHASTSDDNIFSISPDWSLSPWCSASPPRMVARPSHQGRGPWDCWWGRLRSRSACRPHAPGGASELTPSHSAEPLFVHS